MNDSTVTHPRAVMSLQGVSRHFMTKKGNDVVALSNTDLTIERHEFVSLIGPSGCGKSTLLKLVSGLLVPSEGKVLVYGKEVSEPRDDIGIVFQKATLLPWLNIIDNITFPMKHKYGRVTSAEQERARQLLEMTGLGEFAQRYPNELSGGMQQRVGIARSLLHDPDILLMDEPFSALDALTRDEMGFELLRIWGERPKTVLFVTHSIQEALLLSDRIAVMSARPGRVTDVIDVPFERPRSMETLSDPAFNALANDIRRQVFSRTPVSAAKGHIVSSSPAGAHGIGKGGRT